MRIECTINSRKGDGKIHRTWKAELIQEGEDLLVFEGIFKDEVRHPELGIIRPGTLSVEYYWQSKAFNVFRFVEPSGELRCFYCNVNLPPKFENQVLDYIDLDIDVLWYPGQAPRILDSHEFELNSRLYRYDDKTVLLAHRATQELLDMIDKGAFPFQLSHAS